MCAKRGGGEKFGKVILLCDYFFKKYESLLHFFLLEQTLYKNE